MRVVGDDEDEDEDDENIAKLSAPELKISCRVHGLTVSGRK